jgi:DNA-binding Lrp family transcriptional regulator
VEQTVAVADDPTLDALDRRLLVALADNPRAGVLPLARALGVARNTVQARLDKLQRRGVITGFGPDIELEALGWTVLAFVTLEISQGRIDDVVGHLRDIPEVIEVHMVTGQGDLLCRVVARTNDHLGGVIAHILEVPGISRTSTVLSLSTPVPARVLPLVARG